MAPSKATAFAALGTGLFLEFAGVDAPSGWVEADGGTVGSGNSGGTSRANDDTQALFNMLWLNYTDVELPIQDSDGSAATRGASAAADWAADMRLTLPDRTGGTYPILIKL